MADYSLVSGALNKRRSYAVRYIPCVIFRIRIE